eukprot:TRINITY_DN3806_c0_g1_i1.p1 TRINITY_DN3806_c0_g1~~TRINITY_DN3806_c0_g1_i1.p1  ORF type:complete len:136 (+),score=27.58 TRINITY_DN3806_c0_g1_i1:1-408(+)
MQRRFRWFTLDVSPPTAFMVVYTFNAKKCTQPNDAIPEASKNDQCSRFSSFGSFHKQTSQVQSNSIGGSYAMSELIFFLEREEERQEIKGRRTTQIDLDARVQFPEKRTIGPQPSQTQKRRTRYFIVIRKICFFG